jgi:hypothetical protein
MDASALRAKGAKAAAAQASASSRPPKGGQSLTQAQGLLDHRLCIGKLPQVRVRNLVDLGGKRGDCQAKGHEGCWCVAGRSLVAGRRAYRYQQPGSRGTNSRCTPSVRAQLNTQGEPAGGSRRQKHRRGVRSWPFGRTRARLAGAPKGVDLRMEPLLKGGKEGRSYRQGRVLYLSHTQCGPVQHGLAAKMRTRPPRRRHGKSAVRPKCCCGAWMS